MSYAGDMATWHMDCSFALASEEPHMSDMEPRPMLHMAPAYLEPETDTERVHRELSSELE